MNEPEHRSAAAPGRRGLENTQVCQKCLALDFPLLEVIHLLASSFCAGACWVNPHTPTGQEG